MANVELPFVVQERLAEILLKDVRLELSVFVPLLIADYLFDFGEGITDCDPVTTIAHFAWLDNPDIAVWLFLLLLFMVIAQKTQVFLVLQPSGNVIGDWQAIAIVSSG